MFMLRLIVFPILIIFLCAAPLGCSKKERPKIRIVGSTTILPFMSRVSEYYSAKGDMEIEVDAHGSLKGVEALLAKECDVAMCSSPIPPEIVADAASDGIQIKGFPFAYDLIVPIVHPSNPVSNLSLTQVTRIYQGKIDTWYAVGGRPGKIDVVVRAPSSGTREVWNRVILSASTGNDSGVVQDSNSGVLAYVAEHPEAIGYVSLSIVNPEVKVLSVDGIAPALDPSIAKEYAISRQLYLFTDEKTLSYPLKSLIVFVLSSDGQQLVRESSFIPRDVLKP